MLLLLVGVPLGNLLYKAGVLVTQTDAGRRCEPGRWGSACLIICARPWRTAASSAGRY